MIFKNLRKKSAKQTVRRSGTANYTHGKNKEIALNGSHKEKQGGVALIIVLGVLSLLAVLGTAFTIDMRLEQKAAVNYTEGVRARYLAKAGVEAAIAALRKYASEFAAFVPENQWDSGWRTTNNIPSSFSTPPVSLGTGTYTVTIIDCASQIYVNANNAGRLLNNLGFVLTDLEGDEGTQIVNAKPSGGYITKENIKEVALNANFTADEYEIIKEYITVHGWDDVSTVKPDLSSEFRAPINVNTADENVLEAVFRNISASLVEQDNSRDYDNDGVRDKTFNYLITPTEADHLADHVVNDSDATIFKRPYTNWEDFEDAMLNADKDAGNDLHIDYDAATSISDAYLVLANCNPNTDLYRLNPNIDRAIDKDLVGDSTYTTEFSFNSNGYFEIESTGTVTDSGGRITSKKIKTVVKIFDIWRQTTQYDFTTGSLAGDLSNTQTYPEYGAGDRLNAKAGSTAGATYDGQIMMETNTITAGLGGGAVFFQANYTPDTDATDDDLTAVTGGGIQGSTSVEQNSIIASDTAEGDLYPDGVFVGYDPTAVGEKLTYTPPANKFLETEECAVQMWVKPGTVAIGTTGYFFYLEDTIKTTDYIAVKRSEDDVILEVNDNDGSGGIQSTTVSGKLVAGEWSYIVASWDHDINNGTQPVLANTDFKLYLYVDGSSPGENVISGATFDITSPPAGEMYIGSKNDTVNQVEATIDEIIFSDKYVNDGTGITAPNRYYDPGTATFKSAPYSVGSIVDWGTITWTEIEPADGTEISNAAIELETRTAANAAGLVGESWAAVFTDPSAANAIIPSNPTGDKCIEYKVTFKADAGSDGNLKDTPVLDDVTITYLSPAQIISWEEITE